MEPEEFIKQKCVEINERLRVEMEGEPWGIEAIDPSLADVLLAMEKIPNSLSLRPYYRESLQFENDGKLLCVWNLHTDLHEQSEETKKLLAEILGY